MVQGGLLTAHPGGVHGDGWSPGGGSSFRQGAGAASPGSPDLETAAAAVQRGGRDEDISTNVTATSSPTTHNGPRARQLNYQVLSFLANPSNIQEHMMLPKLDTFVCLMNEGPS